MFDQQCEYPYGVPNPKQYGQMVDVYAALSDDDVADIPDAEAQERGLLTEKLREAGVARS